MPETPTLTPSDRRVLDAIAAAGGTASNPDLRDRHGFTLVGAQRRKLNAAGLATSTKHGRYFVHTVAGKPSTDSTAIRQATRSATAQQHQIIERASINPFASTVTAALPSIQTRMLDNGRQGDRFGDRKVFISTLHRRLTETDPRFRDMGLAEFKQQLLLANRQGLVTLARADYVLAMDYADVEASHVHDLGSDFHFVIDESAR